MAAGGTYVRVLYDYEYQIQDGTTIKFTAGEELLLFKKTNLEWWAVIRPNEKRPQHVPANYVEEFQKSAMPAGDGPPPPRPLKKPAPKPPTKPKFPKPSMEDEVLKELDSVLDSVALEEDVLMDMNMEKDIKEEDEEPQYSNIEELSKEKETASERPVSPEVDYKEDDSDRIEDLSPPLPSPSLGPRAGSETSGYKTDSRESLDSPVPVNTPDLYEPPEYANLSITNLSPETNQPNGYRDDNEEDKGDLPEYANLEELQMTLRPDPPPAKPPEGAKPEDIISPQCHMYKEENTGRSYYHNVETGETSWKPPRREKPPPECKPGEEDGASTDAVPRRPVQVNSFGTPVFLSSDPMEELEGLPNGWKEEKSDSGEVCYVHEHSKDKWHSATDGTGKQYFYKEGSSATSWSLPKVTSLAPFLSRRHGSCDQMSDLVGDDNQSNDPSTSAVPSTSSQKHKVRASWAGTENPALGAGWKRILPPNVPSILSPSLLPDGLKEEPEEEGEERRSSVFRPAASRLLSSPACVETSNGGRNSTNLSIKRKAPKPPMQRASAVPSAQMLEKSSLLNKTKLTDSNGKKVKKNWSQSFVVAQGTQVIMYKDQKAAQPKAGSSLGRAEVTLDLLGANVQLFTTAKDISSKKNFIQLTVADGSSFLLQHDKDTMIQEWYNILQHNTTSLTPIHHSASLPSLEEPLDIQGGGSLERGASLMPPELNSSKHSRKGSKRERPKTPENELSSAEKTRIKMRLINWLLRRPTLESLQEKGIIKDGIFGSHLHNIVEVERCLVPKFVTNCIQAIEARGLDVDGVYRVNGNVGQMQKLRYMVDQNQPYDLMDPEWDIHVISGALKLFFRELREPLFPFSFFQKFMDCISLSDRLKKFKAMRELVKQLPTPNKETMKVLFAHFAKVIEHSDKNRMLPQNMAIVFGPTLMWPAQETGNMALTLVCQNQVIEIFILDQARMFT